MQRDEHPGVRSKLLSSHQLARLHTFEAAARHGSFALAADELSLSPSAVSHRISALEEALGFLLFQRFHRKVALTTEGSASSGRSPPPWSSSIRRCWRSGSRRCRDL